jgi:hypothetical protein
VHLVSVAASPATKRARDPFKKFQVAICAIASFYLRTQAVCYRFFSQPAFPTDPKPVQIATNDGAPRQRATERIGP